MIKLPFIREICLLLGALAFNADCALSPQVGGPLPGAPFHSFDSLSKALDSPSLGVRSRAVQELGQLAETSPEARHRLIDLLFSREVYEVEQELTYSLVKIGTPVSDEIETRVKTGSKMTYHVVKCVGLMGASARVLLPSVERMITQNSSAERLLVTLYVCAANLGGDLRKCEKKLMETLASPSANVVRTLGDIAALRPRWEFSRDFRELLESYLERDDSSGVEAGIVIANSDSRSDAVVARVKKAAEMTRKTEELPYYRLIYPMLLAKMDPDRSIEHFKDAFAFLGSIEEYERSTGAAAHQSASQLVDDSLLKSVFPLLSDGDKRIQLGAILFCQVAGLRARESAPTLIKLIKTQGDSKVQEAAADALGNVATMKDAPRLKELLHGDYSSNLKESIEKALQKIDLSK